MKVKLFFVALLLHGSVFSGLTPPTYYLDLGYNGRFLKTGYLNGGNFRAGFYNNSNKKCLLALSLGFVYYHNFKHTITDTLPNFKGIKSLGFPYFSIEPILNFSDNFRISFPIKSSFNGSVFTRYGPHSEYGSDFSWINNNHLSMFSVGISTVKRLKGNIFSGAEFDYNIIYNYSEIQPSIGKRGCYNGLNINIFLRYCFE